MNGIQHSFSKNAIRITINAEIYPIQAVMGACHIFTDRAYIILDGDPQKELLIWIKAREAFSKERLGILAKEFYNELLNQTMRLKLISANKQMRELVIGSAMLGAVGDTIHMPKTPQQTKKNKYDREIDALLKKEISLSSGTKGKNQDPLKIFNLWEKSKNKSELKKSKNNDSQVK